MFENILNSLKSEVGDQILKQTNLPSDKLSGVFSVIGEVTKKEVSGQMLGGNLSNVMNLFSNQPNNPAASLLQNNITSGVISKLVGKLGLSQGVADTIAGIAIPALINLITKKNSQTPDTDPSPLQEIFGGKKSGLGGIAGNIMGKIFK